VKVRVEASDALGAFEEALLEARNRGYSPRWPDAHIFAVKMADELRLGERVGLYCYGGIDRSPFIAALVLHWLESTSLGEAYTVVLKRRPQAFRHPEWERGFREWLAGLGRKA